MFLDNEEPSTQQRGSINTAETEEERDGDSFTPHHQRCLSRMVLCGTGINRSVQSGTKVTLFIGSACALVTTVGDRSKDAIIIVFLAIHEGIVPRSP